MENTKKSTRKQGLEIPACLAEGEGKLRTYLNVLKDYDDVLERLREKSRIQEARQLRGRPSRPGVDTVVVFAPQMRIPLNQGYFPWPTRKRLSFRAMAGELKTFLEGGTTVESFKKNQCNFWDPWGERGYLTSRGLEHYRAGNLGPIYGAQWRRFGSTVEPEYQVDQLEWMIKNIIDKPYDRRHIVTAWNPQENDKMALPPCHIMWQCWLNDDRSELSMHLYMRSGDMFIGVPFNIGSYALLTQLICNELADRTEGALHPRPGELVLTIGDCHVYKNHIEQVDIYLSREVREFPKIDSDCLHRSISNWRETGEIALTGYNPHPAIKAPVAV